MGRQPLKFDPIVAQGQLSSFPGRSRNFIGDIIAGPFVFDDIGAMNTGAYIHLNPVRAGIVEDVRALTAYPFTGYSALMGRIERSWLDTEYVLALFGRTVSEARKKLLEHLTKWSTKGHCADLTGGGLIRSAGGWRAVKEARRNGIKISNDERILGISDLVETTLNQAEETFDRRTKLRSAGIDLSALTAAVIIPQFKVSFAHIFVYE